MSPDKKPTPSANKGISINGDVKDSIVIAGDNNVVTKQTIIQRIINFILPTETESIEQRNRRILLNHVENAWIKGVLDASLHGAALLDLGIKKDPEAVTKYPWAIKKESTDEALPAGTSMLEIFDSIGMGRSLLILGAPGSGKTTMLLELARQLIARAREDVTQPIPMVFNLASWTEKLTLADWLAQELNNLYSVPRKTAPDWVKGNKLLLLLDGLDEVRQEGRAKCVEAINAFRKEHGLTSLAVCSRSQDYADLNAKLSFEGAIEVQPLTQKQITEFFNRFGKEMAGIKQVLKKDSALREMAETPLFLSIMLMAYRDKQDVEVLASGNEKARRKHLFDAYIERMFERTEHSKSEVFIKRDVLRWLSWLAQKLILHDQSVFLLERIKRTWLRSNSQKRLHKVITGAVVWLSSVLVLLLATWLVSKIFQDDEQELFVILGLILAAIFGTAIGIVSALVSGIFEKPTEVLLWTRRKAWLMFTSPCIGLITGVFLGRGFASLTNRLSEIWDMFNVFGILHTYYSLIFGFIGLICVLVVAVRYGTENIELEIKTKPNQGIQKSMKNAIVFGFFIWLMVAMSLVFFSTLQNIQLPSLDMFVIDSFLALPIGMIGGLLTGGQAVINHYTLRFIFLLNHQITWNYVPFLDYCVDLIFLRRVGGGYIFVHRLLMEHFAEMYVETPTSKGN